jgi:Lar family restriction alleviation protein
MDLKPCPFCGAEPVIGPGLNTHGACVWQIRCFRLSCPMDGVYGTGFGTEEKAIEAWNTRWQPAGKARQCIK